MRFRVSHINGPDGRIVDTEVFDVRRDAEDRIIAVMPLIASDELLVFEVTDDRACEVCGDPSCKGWSEAHDDASDN